MFRRRKPVETACEVSPHEHRQLFDGQKEIKSYMEDHLFKSLTEILHITDDIKGCVRVLSTNYKILVEQYVEMSSSQRQMMDTFVTVMDANLQVMEIRNKELRQEQQELRQKQRELMESLGSTNDDNT